MGQRIRQRGRSQVLDPFGQLGVHPGLVRRGARERSRLPRAACRTQFGAFGGRSGGIRGRRIACNARTRPPEGRSTPGFGLPAKELDILEVDDRATETGAGAPSMALRLAVAGWPVRPMRQVILSRRPAPILGKSPNRNFSVPVDMARRRCAGDTPRPEVNVKRKHLWTPP